MIDRVSTQILYAVTGIVLARELSQADFGLVGALLVFQAFASLLVDSGFSYALIQRQRPSRLDYSTVLWFNLGIAALLYIILFFAAPLIADFFQGERQLIPLSRVMFLTIILNAAGIVQTNRLMKAMDVRMVAVSNSLGLVLGAVVGIVLAVTGFGAWALVWQSVVVALSKVLVLWTTSRWRPLWRFSWVSLRSFFGLGSKMMLQSFLNTLFQKIYAFVIGNRVSITALGYYSQSDKWATMGSASLSQVFTSSFLPPLSAVQDEPLRFASMVSKMNRFAAYLIFPVMLGLTAMATPIFHTLFGTKWDPSIILFQILLLRGIFIILNSLYTNYILALGHGNAILRLEVVRDVVAIVALVATFPFMHLTAPGAPVLGIEILLWGQLAAAAITWVATLIVMARITGIKASRFLLDMLPYLVQTLIIIPIIIAAGSLVQPAWLKLIIEATLALAIYIGANALLESKIQSDVFAFLRGKKNFA